MHVELGVQGHTVFGVQGDRSQPHRHQHLRQGVHDGLLEGDGTAKPTVRGARQAPQSELVVLSTIFPPFGVALIRF